MNLGRRNETKWVIYNTTTKEVFDIFRNKATAEKVKYERTRALKYKLDELIVRNFYGNT